MLLAVSLEDLGAKNGAVLQVVKNVFLGDVLRKGGEVDHLCWGAAVSVVLGCVTVKSVEVGVEVLMGVCTWSYIGVSGEIDVHMLAKKRSTLHLQAMHTLVCTREYIKVEKDA